MDERPWVDKVVTTYPNINPFYYSPSDDEVAGCFDYVIKAHDVPINGSVPISFYFVMKLAAEQNIKVLLDGQGSDEYLAGYRPSFPRLIGGHLRQLRLLAALKSLRHHTKRQSLPFAKSLRLLLTSLPTAVLTEQQLCTTRYIYGRQFLPFDKTVPFQLEQVEGSRLDQYLYHLMFKTFLPSLLHYSDRISMAFSIECRVPFLDHRLVEYVFSLPDEDKIFEGQTKYILRNSLAGILPEPISSRKVKQPFLGGELFKWLRGPLRHLVEANFHYDRLSMLNQKRTKQVLEKYKKGDNSNGFLVWRLAVLNYWVNQQ